MDINKVKENHIGKMVVHFKVIIQEISNKKDSTSQVKEHIKVKLTMML